MLSDIGIVSYRNNQPHQMKRFRILKDVTYTLLGQSNSSTRFVKWRFPLRKLRMNFSGAGAGAEAQNSIWAMTWSDEVTNVPILDMESELRFTET